MEYEGLMEGSGYEDPDSRESHHSGSRPRLYAPSLPTIRDSSPVPLASLVPVASESSASTPGMADRSFTARALNEASYLPRGEYEYGAPPAPEESPALRSADDTTLEADTTFVQGDRRRWGMASQMLGEEVRLRLMASSPTPSSADSESTARPCPSEEKEEEAPATDSVAHDEDQMNDESFSLI